MDLVMSFFLFELAGNAQLTDVAAPVRSSRYRLLCGYSGGSYLPAISSTAAMIIDRHQPVSLWRSRAARRFFRPFLIVRSKESSAIALACTLTSR